MSLVALTARVHKKMSKPIALSGGIYGRRNTGKLVSSNSAGGVIKTVVIDTGSGNWTVPADALGPFQAALWSAGGRGAGGNNQSNPSGGSGALAIKSTALSGALLTASEIYAYVIAATGSNSTFMGMTCTSGGNATASDSTGTAGAAGVASGGDLNIDGSAGTTVTPSSNAEFQQSSDGNNGANSTNAGKGGIRYQNGASSYMAGPGGAGAPSSTDGLFQGGKGGNGAGGGGGSSENLPTPGENGQTPGAGGGGGTATGSGTPGQSTGGAGRIIICYLASA